MALKFALIRIGAALLTALIMTACGEAATPTPEMVPSVPGSISGSSPPVTTINSAGGGQTITPASGSFSPGERAATVSPQSSAIQMIADPTNLKVGDSVTITGAGNQTPILDYTLLIDGNEFAKAGSPAQKAGTDPKRIFEFVSASRNGTGVTFVLKAIQPGKVTVSLKGSGEATTSSGARAYFTTVSNSTELSVTT